MNHPSKHPPSIKRLQSYIDRTGLQGLAPPGDAKIIGLNLHEKQGLSNKIYLMRVKIANKSVETLILRLYDGGGKAAREFELLNLLWSKSLPVPKAYAFDESNRTLGKPFIIMERIEQTPLKEGRNLIEAAALSLAKIHAIAPNELKGILEKRGDYPKRELEGLKFLSTALIFTTVKPPSSLIRCLRYIGPLGKNLSEGRALLIHGDYNFDNMIYSNGKAYIVDWENAEIAEPTFDIAYFCNFLDFSEGLEGRIEGELSSRFLGEYERHGGIVKELELYRKLAALKLLIFLDVLSSKNLFSLLTRSYTKFRDLKTSHLMEKLKTYLFEVLEGASSSLR
ncbi:MAG: phosphotransferase family protein [Thermoproteota archaeon]